MKTALLLLLLTCPLTALAQVNIYCGTNTGLIDCTSSSPSLRQATSRTVANPTGGERSTSEIEIDNRNGDVVFLTADTSAPMGLVSLLTSNKGAKTDYHVNLPGTRYLNQPKNAHDVNLIGDLFGKVDIDVSGYRGANGKATSSLCMDKVIGGFFGISAPDDTLREYRSANSLSTCNAGILTEIARVAPTDFCPPGYNYKPEFDDSATQSFLANRRRYKNKCTKTILTGCDPANNVGCDANEVEDPQPGSAPSYVYVDMGASCPTDYTLTGPTQDYPTQDVGETVVCTTDSCPQANLRRSFETRYGQNLVRQPGESGSFGGKVNLFVYDLDSMNIQYSNGSNGAIGQNDIVQTPSRKYCSRILDNRTATLDMTSPERNSPAVNLHVITFYPFSFQDPSGLPNVIFPERLQNEAIGLYKKMDSTTRDFLFRNVIKSAGNID